MKSGVAATKIWSKPQILEKDSSWTIIPKLVASLLLEELDLGVIIILPLRIIFYLTSEKSFVMFFINRYSLNIG